MLFFLLPIIALVASGAYAALDRSSRRIWGRVPMRKRITKTPYRGETAPVVAGYYGKAPRAVRVAAFASYLTVFLLPIEWLIDRWRVGAYPERREFKSSLSAARALMERKEEALDRARQAGELRALVVVSLGSIVFALAPILLADPVLLASLVVALAGLGAHAWLLRRLGKTEKEAYAPEGEQPDDAAAPAKSAEEEDAAVPPWLLRALARRAESRAPRVRVEANEVRVATTTTEATSDADVEVDEEGAARREKRI